MSRAQVSGAIKEKYLQGVTVELDEDHNEFIKTLMSMHREEVYYNTHGKSNGEIAVMMSDMAFAWSEFYGCSIQVDVTGTDDYETANKLCIDSYVFTLSSLFSLTRDYSATREAQINIVFDKMGICVEFGFKIAKEYRQLILSRESKALMHFAKHSESRLFLCNFYQTEDEYAVKTYPWYKNPNSSDLKEKKPRLIYNS